MVVAFHGTLLRTKPWRLIVQPENSMIQMQTANTMAISANPISTGRKGPLPMLARKPIFIVSSLLTEVTERASVVPRRKPGHVNSSTAPDHLLHPPCVQAHVNTPCVRT